MFDRFPSQDSLASSGGRGASGPDSGGFGSRWVEGSGGDPLSNTVVCGCCGGIFYSGPTGNGHVGAIVNADDRGVFGPNGKPSLSSQDAGTQLTRGNLSWVPSGQPLGTAVTVSFAFRTTAPTTMPDDTTGFTQFTQIQIAATLLALQSWSDVANITFQRVDDGGGFSDNATILFGNYSSGAAGAAAFAYLPGSAAVSSVTGDIWINSSLANNVSPGLLNYGFHTITHEIGHAIGLRHPADYNASAGVSITYGSNATYFEDSRQYTVMSYFGEGNTGGNFGGGIFSSAPLMDDISAAQRLYGANMTTRTGDTVYGFNSNAGQAWFSPSAAHQNRMIFAVWDAGGIDTLDMSGYTMAQTIDLRQGHFSSVGGLVGNVSIALGAVIENAVGGTGADTIHGNAANNVIRGNGGNDAIDGGLGTDTVVFAGARSAYTITWNGQTGTVTGNGSTVTVTNVEFLQFSDTTIATEPTGGLRVVGDATSNTITGTAFDDVIGGAGGVDTLNGLAGNDLLDGGSGNDVLNGGTGDDTLIGGLGNDTLNGGEGWDSADYAGAGGSVTVNLAVGVAGGAAGEDTLTGIEQVNGSRFNDVITGDAGANTLNGGGGTDVLRGGGGNDRLVAGNGVADGAPDVVKLQGQSIATIQTALSLDSAFDLAARVGVDNATTIPHATVSATTGGNLDYYAITIGAGSSVTLDIDNASFDSTLRVFNASGVEIIQNDDGSDTDGARTDSKITLTFTEAGVYYIQVGQFSTNPPAGTAPGAGGFSTQNLPNNGTYTLHASVGGHSVVPISTLGSQLFGEDGDDTLVGGNGNDRLDGGSGVDTVVYAGTFASYTVTTTDGVTTVSGADIGTDTLVNIERVQFSDRTVSLTAGSVVGTAGNDDLIGTSGNDVIDALGGNDLIRASGGSDTIDGGTGTDTLALSGVASDYLIRQTANGWQVLKGTVDVDTLTNIERVSFAGGVSVTIAEAFQASFDPYAYIVGYSDLRSYINDPVGAYKHYIQYGRMEGRVADSFDGLRYIASNPDLIGVIGANERAASEHYVRYGQGEGRPTATFDPLVYGASNPDLARIFGNDGVGLSRHYVQWGAGEGRPAAGFNALLYGASNADLAIAIGANQGALLNHYLLYGVNEGRPTASFNALHYGASNGDLAQAYGGNEAALMTHYIQYGVNEGRPFNSFDIEAYLAVNPDLALAYRNDPQGALRHYLDYGQDEGRALSGFDATAYLLTYPDLAGLDLEELIDHWLAWGVGEGRIGDGLFGREQPSHALVNGTANAAIEQSGDRDWYVVNLTAGQTITVDLRGPGAGQGTLNDGYLTLHDANGNIVAFDDNAGPQSDARVTFTATSSGTYYIVASGVQGSVGSYTINVASSGAAPQTLPPEAIDKPVVEIDLAPQTFPSEEAAAKLADPSLPWILPSDFIVPLPDNTSVIEATGADSNVMRWDGFTDWHFEAIVDTTTDAETFPILLDTWSQINEPGLRTQDDDWLMST